MFSPLNYRFYAFDTELEVELDCLLSFDANSESDSIDCYSDNMSIVLDMSSRTPNELAKFSFEYFHDNYSIDIDRVSIASFLTTIKAWAVDSKGFVHILVRSMYD